MGHSNETGNAKLGTADVDGLVNTHPYFMYSGGCLSGAFDWNDAIAEHHVKSEHGAVGVVMNSRVGRNIQMNSTDYFMDRDFWYAIFQLGQRRFGEAHMYARLQSVPPPSSVEGRWQYFVGTLFADPETALSMPGLPGNAEGVVYEDVNGSYQRESWEPGLSGWTVFADVEKDGSRNQASTSWVATDTPQAIQDFTTTRSTIELSGLPGRVLDVNLQLNITHTYDADLEVYLESTSGRRVELFTGVGGSGDNFNNTTLDDEAITSITAGSAPFSGSYRPMGSLADFDLQDPNGLWTLEVYDRAGGDSGTLWSWSITVQYGDPAVTTDGSGDFAFVDLHPGRYVFREQLPAGWSATEVPGYPQQGLYVPPGQVLGDVNFGNVQPAEISGVAWHDINGDGQHHFDEPRLGGWDVYLDGNSNGFFDPGEPLTQTDIERKLCVQLGYAGQLPRADDGTG